MYSFRIKTIASLIDKDEVVLDVGTDHAYLPIYLLKNNIVKSAYGSDVSENVIKIAKSNVMKNKLSSKIKIILSDGLKDVEFNYTTLVIAGMGFSTIKKILRSGKLPKNLIIQTNSDHDKLRRYMNLKGYKIKKELTILDNNKFYVIIKYIKGYEFLSKKYILFGNSLNKNYYNYLIDKYNLLINKVPNKKRKEFVKKINILNKLLKEC